MTNRIAVVGREHGQGRWPGGLCGHAHLLKLFWRVLPVFSTCCSTGSCSFWRGGDP
jgi:hypothetical protein